MIKSKEIIEAKILIVDDQPFNLDILEDILREEGYQNIHRLTDPFQVVNMQEQENFDIILMDINMPGKNGFQVIEELNNNEIDSYVPILVLTAEPDYKIEALKAGAKDFLSKPYDLTEIKVRIYNMLEVKVLYKKLEEYSQTMTMLAMYDALTGLPNRRLLFDRISAAMSFSNRNNSGFSIIYLDLNGFKNINDTHGHDVGDLLLRKVSDRLLSCVRKEDTVARLGGDEFVLLLWDLKIQEGVHDIVMKILNNIAQSYTLNEIKIKITASAGVSIYPLHSDNINTLIKKADMALYESKKISNNNYLIASN